MVDALLGARAAPRRQHAAFLTRLATCRGMDESKRLWAERGGETRAGAAADCGRLTAVAVGGTARALSPVICHFVMTSSIRCVLCVWIFVDGFFRFVFV